jgi:transglutaminase-like putative cysteine protease
LCIPARYVSGYAVGLTPPDFHGFFEAYLGARWYLFDATRMAPRDGVVRIGTGRDAADASFATLIGAATLQQMMVTAKELTDEIEESLWSDTNQPFPTA